MIESKMITDWFHAAKWGVFAHYGPASGHEGWNVSCRSIRAGQFRSIPTDSRSETTYTKEEGRDP